MRILPAYLVAISLAFSAVAQADPPNAAGSAIVLGASTEQHQDLQRVLDDQAFRIVDLKLRSRRSLASEMFAYEAPDGELYLPAASFFEAIGFPIQPGRDGHLQGWFIRENQTFDLSPGAVEIAGRARHVDTSIVVDLDGETHLSLSALNEWFALHAAWRRDEQIIDLSPKYLLPPEEAERRLSQRSGGNAGANLQTEGLVRADDDYAWFSTPLANVNLSGGWTSLDGRTETRLSGAMLAEGDFLKSTARLSLSAGLDQPTTTRLTLGRYDSSGGLLGPLNATYVEAGDIVAPASPLLREITSGVGVRIGRAPINLGGDFDATDIVGDATPGWQAELYRDAEFLAFQIVPADGRFQFLETPLLYGQNRFRIELYGPSGERQTIHRTIDIAAEMIQPGSFHYHAVALSKGQSIFEGDRADPFFQQQEAGRVVRETGRHAQVGAGFGVTRNLALNATLSSDWTDSGETRTSAGAGFSVNAGPILWQGQSLWQDKGAAAARLGLLSGIGPISVSASHEHYGRGFESSASSLYGAADLASRTQGQLSGRWRDVGVTLALAESSRRDKGFTRSAALRLYGQVKGASVSHSLSWRESRHGSTERENLGGALALSQGLGDTRVRLIADYELSPEVEPKRLSGEVNRRWSDWYLSAATSYDFEYESLEMRLRAVRDWSGVRLGADASYSPDRNDVRLLATLSFAVDRDPVSGAVRLGRNARSSRGTIALRAYEDANANGRRDDSESYLDGMTYRSEPRGRIRSDDGVSLLEDLPTHRPIAINHLAEDIEDPYLVPASKGVIVVPRPGATIEVDVPIVESGELEITLHDEAGEPLANRVVGIATCDGQRTFKERSAHDGLAYFPFLAPGCYKLDGAFQAQTSKTDRNAPNILIRPGQIIRKDYTVVAPA